MASGPADAVITAWSGSPNSSSFYSTEVISSRVRGYINVSKYVLCNPAQVLVAFPTYR